jgi:hypothetical protein
MQATCCGSAAGIKSAGNRAGSRVKWFFMMD